MTVIYLVHSMYLIMYVHTCIVCDSSLLLTTWADWWTIIDNIQYSVDFNISNCLWLRLCIYFFGLGCPYGSCGMVFLWFMCMCSWLNFNVNALGPTPTGVAVSSSGCQSLRVAWTHRAPTPPLTLIHYRVMYQPQGSSFQNATTSSEGSYTITGLAPATTYTVAVEAQTQLGYGYFCCRPTATTHNGEASSDACRGQKLLMATCYISYVSHVTGIQHGCHASVLYTFVYLN